MSEQRKRDLRPGYRAIAAFLVLGFALIGFTRFEERAILGAPGSPANAMSALATLTSSDADVSYSGPPEDSVALSDASQVPTDRIRRILRDRDFANGAARLIPAPDASPNATGEGGVPAGVSGDPVVADLAALAPTETSPVQFASLTPTLPGQGAPLFAANLPADGGGNGNGGGTPGGGTNPPPALPSPAVPISPVPEPDTWFMLLMGLFAVGGALRYRGGAVQVREASLLG